MITGLIKKIERVVMESDSEILCYRQALALQKSCFTDPGNPISFEYTVVEIGK